MPNPTAPPETSENPQIKFENHDISIYTLESSRALRARAKILLLLVEETYERSAAHISMATLRNLGTDYQLRDVK